MKADIILAQKKKGKEPLALFPSLLLLNPV